MSKIEKITPVERDEAWLTERLAELKQQRLDKAKVEINVILEKYKLGAGVQIDHSGVNILLDNFFANRDTKKINIEYALWDKGE